MPNIGAVVDYAKTDYQFKRNIRLQKKPKTFMST